jgi:hypothetical protein
MRLFVPADDYAEAAKSTSIPGQVSISMMDLAWEAICEHLAKVAPAAVEHMEKLSAASNPPPYNSWQQDFPEMVLDLDEDGCRALVKELVVADISALAPDLRRSVWELVSAVARGAVNGGLVGY